MRGDFSTWNKDRSRNFRGTLHQQGRVLLDRDWNAQTEVFNEWQETAGRDAFGAGVAAVPAEVPASFKITKAEKILAAPVHVDVSINKGRVWADGLLVESAQDLIRTATYLNPPPGQISDLPNGLRDAVILETWLEELNPFQNPALLIEPALGGVDTTERVHTAFRFRLFRMAAGETCDSIIPKLKDDFSVKGKLTAKLDPVVNIDGDCPVVEGGGYTGFEHRLYRIEIAETDRVNESWFKWSHFNGGLVGRGFFDAANSKVVIKANENAIVHSGINSFYLEAMEFDPALGYWRVIYGAKNITLAADHTLTLPAAAGDKFIGAIPPSPAGIEKIYFFRLWNGIERVNDFAVAPEKDLPDLVGIKLKFEAEVAGKYTPHDFWTFEVRAGEIGNPLVLVDNKPPEGIFYHRVPLAEVNWTGNVVIGDDIEDCRRIFQPLTKLKTCCTYRVGDGINSHGDFTKIQDAINALPKDGGEVCILPGIFVENIVLDAPHNRNIILKGCGKRTVIRPLNNDPVIDGKYNAVIRVRYGQNIQIESLAVEAHDDGVGIYLEGEEKTAANENSENYLKNILLSQLYVTAAKNNAIKGFAAQLLTFRDSVIHIKDVQTRKPAVYLEGDDVLVERNEIRVLPGRAVAAKMGDEFTNDAEMFTAAQEASGGLQIGGGSDRVRIIDNLIVNGTGNGISLGRIDLEKDGDEVPNRDPFEPKDQDEDCCNPDDGVIDEDEVDENGFVAIAGPPLYDILIKFNRIYNMGRNGIGVATFFGLGDAAKPIDVNALDKITEKGVIMVSKLVISENRIERCMNISPQPIKGKMSHLMGYGGIALAVVDDLVIRDNFIVDNCRDCRDPICGIFVLMVIDADISRNDITENIPQQYEDINAENVGIGPRGGIWIYFALGLSNLISPSSHKEFAKSGGFGQSHGGHAVKIHENVVLAPLGRSLTVMVFGDASIVGNRFTSFGIQPVDVIKLFLAIVVEKKFNMATFLQILGLVAGNVFIFDLASTRLANLLTQGMADTKKAAAVAGAPPGSAAVNTGNVQSSAAEPNRFLIELARALTEGGFILFSNNQCKLNPQVDEFSFALSAILIAGMADVGFHNNQASCDLPDDLLLTNAVLAGGTLRASDNWFKETLDSVGVSAMTFGVLNITTDNESVHCLDIKGFQFLNKHNLVLGAFALGVFGDITGEAGNKLREFCASGERLSRMGVRIFEVMQGNQGHTAGTDFKGIKITRNWR